ncbi:hypothetical protein DVH24_009869 [Malus domestica]|uniref:Uncharacterized protein n=1 Tax=Malus domestica TaxID=3750 RepID=A0A498KJD9_MALDO|nr:hypothetical protein DVH24_009869 [Malus domestica]
MGVLKILCQNPTRAPTTSRAQIHRSTILSTLGPYHTLTVLFLELTQELRMGHPSWDCSRANSINFEVLTEPEASELPKDLILAKDRNIHIRLT